MIDWVQSTDWTILYWIQENIKCGFLDFLVPKLTALGNGGTIWIIIGVLMTISKKYRKNGIAVLIGLALGGIIGNLCIKNLVARARPCWIDTTVSLLIKTPTGYSFPSGHTLSSTIGAFIITATNHKFGWVVIPLAVIIACTRLYLFVHFPSDVLVAALLGLVIGTCVELARRKICKEQ